MVEKICRNCKFWERYKNGEGYIKRGICRSEKFIDVSEQSSNCGNDTLEYTDFESYAATFNTGENFGCIHFEEGEPK